MMLKSIRCLVVVLVPFALGLLLSACSSGGPEAAAQKGFEEWTKNISVAYRNVSYRTVSSKEAFATVEVTGEFQNAPNTPWVEQQAAVQVVKQGDQWRPPTQFVFAPSPRAVQTAQAISNATATVESARASATQAAFEQVRQATATAAIQAAQATATAVTQAAQATATAATQAAQAAAAAATRATATAVASDRQKAAGANGDFNGSSLPPEWNVLRPDPNRWRLDQGALVVMPAPEIEWNRWYNTFIRPLPTLNSDLDITIKLQVTEKNVDRQFFWMRLQAGEETQNGPWMDVAVSLARSGSSVYSKTNSGGGQKQVNTPLDGDTYLRISRRKGRIELCHLLQQRCQVVDVRERMEQRSCV
ncbi:MAG: hypothetical protein M1358_20185 [Chloroflexi bacterium]|nr:hypothetical protein [Chloroflexota bacterium]